LPPLPFEISSVGLVVEHGPVLPPLRRFGVPVGQAMDRTTARLLRVPEPDAAVQEVFGQAKLRADRPLWVVKSELPGLVEVLALREEETVAISPKDKRAAYFVVTRTEIRPVRFRFDLESGPIRVVPLEPADPPRDMWHSRFAISPKGSRQGIRLTETVRPRAEFRRSLPTTPGTIQVTPSGEVIVIGPDGPTIGGYGIAGIIADADLDRFFMLPPGATVEFAEVSIEQALVLKGAHEHRIEALCEEFGRAIEANLD